MALDIEWRNAGPLWPLALTDSAPARRLAQPALLRFDSDTFMDDLAATMADAPADIKDLVLRAETWRDEIAGWNTEAGLANESTPKLYQASQGRFYLVAANLVCRKAGLPDHKVNLAKKEKVGFVLRRVAKKDGANLIDPADPSTFTEEAWRSGGGVGDWTALSNGQGLADGEEVLPMFPLNYQQKGQPRRLWSGFIPTGARESAPTPDPADLGFPANADPRPDWFDARVGRPLNDLLHTGSLPQSDQRPPLESRREISLFWLLDCAEFLVDHLPSIWQALNGGSAPDPATAPEFDRIYRVFSGLALLDGSTLAGALIKVHGDADFLRENGELSDDTQYDLTDLTHNDATIGNPTGRAAYGPDSDTGSWSYRYLRPDPSVYTGTAALPMDLPDLPSAPKIEEDAEFWIRCVYIRSQCQLDAAATISEPCRLFKLGGFFDADAPARPINIQMPKDTGVAQLRRFKRAVSMTLSDKLRKQAERFRGKGMTDLEEGNLAVVDNSLSFGMICSLSIPIITICAMILLLIMVQLLNIVFWWLPFFKICLPRIKT